MNKERLQLLAKDLRKEYPRSPHAMLGGYVIAARTLDKCRAFLLGMNGEYNFWPCSLSGQLYSFTGLDPERVKEFVSTGATDEEFGNWLAANSKVKERMEIIRWNNKMQALRLCDLDDHAQEFLEGYIETYVPKHRPIYIWFDVYDLEEDRF
jgi:hypothetical protein